MPVLLFTSLHHTGGATGVYSSALIILSTLASG